MCLLFPGFLVFFFFAHREQLSGLQIGQLCVWERARPLDLRPTAAHSLEVQWSAPNCQFLGCTQDALRKNLLLFPQRKPSPWDPGGLGNQLLTEEGMTGQGTRNLRLWPSRAAVGFCCESVLLQRSPNSSASSLLTSSKLEPGRGEGKRAESLCRDDVLAL